MLFRGDKGHLDTLGNRCCQGEVREVEASFVPGVV